MSVWLTRLLRLRAIAQTGQTYTKDPFDRQRFDELAQLVDGMLSDLVDAPPVKITEAFDFDTGYPTPKVDIRAGVFQNGRVLLVREKADGCWSLPGGWADQTDAASQAAERETEEEAGCKVTAVKLVAVKDRNRHPYANPMLQGVYKMLFLCDLTQPPPTELRKLIAERDDSEIAEADFFGLDDLPELSRGRTLPADIELLDLHNRNRELPTSFD
ncbi:MAG: NUDIX hydrolase N-terminal domain-containing protein [Proteobacteria bacterium]|nr:NUDIX hydrolase N-terminal domain-containing protein [Pseudomonadota bacterium]